MRQERLAQILNQFSSRRILVLGDFFLDKYLMLDRRLSEISLETDLEAYQVTALRSSPGAAGTVVNNLRALGVEVTALGVIGDDGEGYDLRRALDSQGVDTGGLIVSAERFTPTYVKPMMRESDGPVHELNRLDIKNRATLSDALQDQVIAELNRLISGVDAVIVADQVPEANCGVITDRVRKALATLAQTPNAPLIAVDSRERAGLYRNVIVKPNAREALTAIGKPPISEAKIDPAAVERAGQTLFDCTGRPVFVTIGALGMLVFSSAGMERVPGVPVSGPLDIVGAGDSVMASLTAALCSGASPAEAAWVGNLVGSITVQQLGTTGTASVEEVLRRNSAQLSAKS